MAVVTKRQWKTSKGEVREAWVLDYRDATGKRIKEQFTLKRDADARRKEVEGQLNAGTHRAEAAKKTVSDACDLYVDKLKAQVDTNLVTEHYYRTTKAQLYNYVSPDSDRAKEHKALQPEKNRVNFSGGIGGVKLSQCTRKVCNEFRDGLQAAGVKIVLTRRIIGSLSRALANAADEDWIAVNPAAGIEVKAPRNERGKFKERVEPPSKAELSLVLSLVTGSLATRMRLSALAGLRASELYELRWGDVSFNGGYLTVSRRVASEKGRKVDVPKSEAGKREVPLSAQMLSELKAWREKASKKDAGDLIFPNRNGGHLDHRNVLERDFKPLMELAVAKAKEKKMRFKPFNWHALRHFAISTWIKDGGMQPKEVQTLAGHSTISVTMDRYGHMFPSADHGSIMDRIAADVLS